jgi:xylose isomerase
LYSGPKSYEIAHLLESLTYIWIFVSVKAHFEFMEKLGVDRWCFHDRDIAPDGKTLAV